MKRLVYIDTSEFTSANFSFNGPKLKTVISRAVSDQIEIGMPSITINEIISQIKKSVHNAEQAILKARTGAKILRNLDDEFSQLLFSSFENTSIYENITIQLEKFLSDSKSIIIGFDNIEPSYVFDLYFSKMAPFGDGKKKAEFPDAFTLSMLSNWAESESKNVLIASSDNDIKEGAKNFNRLEYVGTLEQLLDKISRIFDELSPSAEKAFELLKDKIEQNICNQFIEMGFILEDQDGEVAEVRVQDVLINVSLLHVDDFEKNYGEAIFDLIATINYEAELSYDDMTTAVYDSEDKNYFILNTIDETVERSEILQGDISITFSLNSDEDIEFSVDFEKQYDIRVSSSYEDEWPYK